MFNKLCWHDYEIIGTKNKGIMLYYIQKCIKCGKVKLI